MIAKITVRVTNLCIFAFVHHCIEQDMIRQLAEELNFHKREVQVLRSEKDTLESVLTLKTQEVRKALTNENFKVEEEMKRHYAH